MLWTPLVSGSTEILGRDMKLRLYYAPIACSLVPLVSLYEAAADFEIRPISLHKGHHLEPEFLQLNPKHMVPVLVVDGEPLTENVAILSCIAGLYPEARLLPSDAKDKLRALSFMAWCSGGIHPHLTRIREPENYCDVAGTEESVRRLAQARLFENFRIVDGLLRGREWVFEHWTSVDAYFFWCWRRASLFNLDLSAFEGYAAHASRIAKRSSVQRALEYEKEVQAEFAKAA